MPRSPGFRLCHGLTMVLMAFILLPLVVTLLGSCLNPSLLGLSSDIWSGRPGDIFDLSAFGYILGTYGSWAFFSLKLALTCVTLCLVVAVPAGFVLATRSFRGAKLLEEVALLPLSIPGITLSIGLIAAHGQLRGHVLVLAGHLLYTLPFMLKVVTTTLRGSDAAGLEAAARSLGAGPWHTLTLVILPTLRQAMMIGSLLVFTVSWGEFNVSFLLNSGWPQTFPAVLYDTFVNQSIQVSSAATTIFLMVVIPAVIAIQWLGGDHPVDLEQGS